MSPMRKLRCQHLVRSENSLSSFIALCHAVVGHDDSSPLEGSGVYFVLIALHRIDATVLQCERERTASVVPCHL